MVAPIVARTTIRFGIMKTPAEMRLQ
jgi:hypothetical protein